MKVGGLGLTGVALISSEEQGSIVSGHLISTMGGTKTLGNVHNEDAELADDTPFNDLRPPLEASASLVPGIT
jgi:hypothetical protein